jgi:hypothetical protein
LQVLDYNGLVSAPWNDRGSRNSVSRGRVSANDVKDFIKVNLSTAVGFAAGYFVGLNVLDWTENASEAIEEAAEAVEDSAKVESVPTESS